MPSVVCQGQLGVEKFNKKELVKNIYFLKRSVNFGLIRITRKSCTRTYKSMFKKLEFYQMDLKNLNKCLVICYSGVILVENSEKLTIST